MNIIRCVLLYALGSTTNWIGTVLIGRMIIGIVGGSSFIIPLHICFTYNRDHHKTRSSYIKYVGVSIGIIGLGIGPLLGSAVTEICNRVRFNEREHRIVMAWHSDLMNGEHRTGMVNGYIIRDRKSYLSTYFLHGGTTKCIFSLFLRLACRRVIFTIAYQ